MTEPIMTSARAEDRTSEQTTHTPASVWSAVGSTGQLDWRNAVRVGKDAVDPEFVRILSAPAEDSAAAVAKFSELLACLERKRIDLMESNRTFMALLELAAVHDGAVYAMLSIHFNLSMGTIRHLGGGNSYVEDLYAQLNDGRAIGVFLATETGFGNNLIGLETKATYLPERECFVLQSPGPRSYKFMPNTMPAALPKIAVVLARLCVGKRSYGIFPFLLPLTDGFSIRKGVKISPLGKKAGFMLDNAITSFDGAEIPLDGLLAGDMLSLTRDGTVTLHEPKAMNRFLKSMQSVNTGKLCMGAGSIAMAKSAVHITHAYGEQRTTFGSSGSMPIGQYHVFRDNLVQDVASLIVYSLWLETLRERTSGPTTQLEARLTCDNDLVNELIVAKALCTWRGQEIQVRCRERCGAQGLFSANKIIDYYVVNNGTVTAEGDNQVLLLKTGQSLIDVKPDVSCNADDPVWACLLVPLQDYFEHLWTRLHDTLKGARPGERFALWNRLGAEILKLTEVFGVLSATRAVWAHKASAPIPRLALEVFLLDWHARLRGELLMNSIDGPARQRMVETRRATLVQRDGQQLLDCISEFGIVEAGVVTPISSKDYVEWYALRHHTQSRSEGLHGQYT